jgi:GR25 family glycosyltransferase involved in LPS biosynthesis
MSVSLICSCKNRIDALRVSLNSWVKFKEITEIIIVDWDSDESIDFLLSHDPRIKIIKVSDEKYFNQPQPLNLAADFATGEYILKVDCDYVINPYYNFFERYFPKDNEFVCGEYEHAVDESQFPEDYNYMLLGREGLLLYDKSYSPFYKYLIGLLFTKKENFNKINGYNELLHNYYAFEDEEIFKRLELSGLKKVKIDFDNSIIHIPHPDSKRVENFKGHVDQPYIREEIYNNLKEIYSEDQLEWEVDYVLSTLHVSLNKNDIGKIDNFYIKRIHEWKLEEISERYFHAKKVNNIKKLEDFPKVNFISLEESKDRQKNLIEQFKKNGVTEFNPLISKRFDQSNDIVTGSQVNILDSGTKGCVVSHIKMIKKWYDESDEKYGFFCEDDLSLESLKYWDFTWKEFIENLPDDADCVQLYCIRDEQRDLKFENRWQTDWSVTAYILTKEYAKRIIDQYYVSENEFNLEVYDTGWYPMPENVLFWGHGKVYSVNLFLEDLKLGTTFSEIDSGIKENHLDSYTYNLNWWKNNSKNNLNLIFGKNNLKKLKVVQIGCNRGYDDLYEYLSLNYKENEIEFGLFVDANKIHIDSVKECYKKYNNIFVENLGIKSPSHEHDHLTFYYHPEESNYEIASCKKEHIQKCIDWPGSSLTDGNIETFEISCITLEELFDRYNLKEIDWLLLDIEGLESDILLNFNWEKYLIKKVEFEYLHLDENAEKIQSLMYNMGYRQVKSLSANDWAFEKVENLGEKSMVHVKNQNYVQIVLDIEELLTEYSSDTENPELNFKIGLWYEVHGQDAAALSFFLRAAERFENDHYAYESLIHGAYCYDRQGTRDMTAKGILQQALVLLPHRPEAYYHLSNFCRKRGFWQDCYIYASTALNFSSFDSIPNFKTDVHFPGKFAIMYEQALAAWDWGKIEESYNILMDIKDNYEIPEEYKVQVEKELEKFKNIECFFTEQYRDILENLSCNKNKNEETNSVNNDIGKIDIVLAGHFDEETPNIINSYLKLDFINNIILSTWKGQYDGSIDHDRVKIVEIEKPIPGTDNRNLQIASAHAGLELVTTEYCAKMRTDQRYYDESMHNMYNYLLNNREFEDQIFVAGIYPNLLFHPRDHVFWGKSCNVKELYDIPLEYNGLSDKIKISKENLHKYYPFFVRNETYIGARYCSKFDETINIMLLEPEKYLHDNCGGWNQSHQVSQNVTTRAFKSFPREGIDLEWNRKGLQHYPYDDQKNGYGECWAEDFQIED